MEKKGSSKEKETLPDQKQKARDQYAPFVNESVNILLDMVVIGSALPVPLTLNTAVSVPGH
jgi:carboxyl-terminal processing protease